MKYNKNNMKINNFKEIKQIRESGKYVNASRDNPYENGVMDYLKNINRWVRNWQEEDTGEGGFVTWLLIVDKYDIYNICMDDSGFEDYYRGYHKNLLDKPIVAKIQLGSTNISIFDVMIDADQEWLNEDGQKLIKALEKIYPTEYFEYVFYNCLDT